MIGRLSHNSLYVVEMEFALDECAEEGSEHHGAVHSRSLGHGQLWTGPPEIDGTRHFKGGLGETTCLRTHLRPSGTADAAWLPGLTGL